ncbi:ROK family transcriptional regulator [Yinghuangia seranimata]|uniref:ROK family transcriptional regulator n=1 Tax=Yinghuangia seranimata TaxID=408067 RepID=UPI00248B5618|nr:ROK family transcriptional regulator [Yinghuangia seranimata]MDI2125618.1 ROK family transcriptional regulator [Yinghuangia seranimata]
MPASREHEGMSALLALIASGTAVTRTELAATCGLSRSTVTQRVNRLLDTGLVVEEGNGASEGGRPPTVLALAPGGGVLLAADLGATHARLAVAGLGGTVLAETDDDIDVDDGPEAVLGLVRDGWARLLGGLGAGVPDVRGVGIGVPGPVEFSTGTVVRPPIMAGWDGFRVPGFFTEHRDVPILVDNDVNLMALGEHRGARATEDSLLYVKIGTGIGCGIVTAGRLYRGGDGAAGDIGHIRLPGHEETVCHCGNTGCVEAVASGAALVQALRAGGLDVGTARDVARLAAEGNTAARRAVRVAAGRIGEVIAAVVSFHNPRVILVGGPFTAVGDEVLAEIKAVVYRRVLPLATRTLRVETGPLGGRAGIVGAIALAQEHALSPGALARWL